VTARATLIVAAGLAALTAAPLAARQVFRSGTDMVVLSVSAIDAANHPVAGLEQKDFVVFEDGIAQEISFFAREPQPIALSLLIDTSTSMEPRMAIAQEAAIGFTKRLTKSDVEQIIDFNSDYVVRQSFTNDLDALEKAIRQTRAGGSTSLYNALYAAFHELNQVRATSTDEVRRQAIVVLSDGEDTTSLISYDDVLSAAKRSNVTVYAIGLRSKDQASVPQRGFKESDFVLRTLSQETGGRVFYVDDAAQLAGVYGQIADELSNQYMIGYLSKNTKRDGAWRAVSVRVTRPNVAARSKSGYFAPPAKK